MSNKEETNKRDDPFLDTLKKALHSANAFFAMKLAPGLLFGNGELVNIAFGSERGMRAMVYELAETLKGDTLDGIENLKHNRIYHFLNRKKNLKATVIEIPHAEKAYECNFVAMVQCFAKTKWESTLYLNQRQEDGHFRMLEQKEGGESVLLTEKDSNLETPELFWKAIEERWPDQEEERLYGWLYDYKIGYSTLRDFDPNRLESILSALHESNGRGYPYSFNGVDYWIVNSLDGMRCLLFRQKEDGGFRSSDLIDYDAIEALGSEK